MIDTPRTLTTAAAGILTLALSQGLARAEPPAPAAAPPAPPAAANPRDAARARAEEHRAKMEEMRAQMDEMRTQHGANCDQMKKMTPEERRAMRETRWKEMRARAAERGVDLPETPPWVAAEQRQQASQEQFENYRKTVEALTPEQREAAQAVFGQGPQGADWAMPPMPPMPPRGGYGYGPQGGYPGYGYPGYGPGYGPGPNWGGPGYLPYDEEGGMETAPSGPAPAPAPAPAAK